MATVVWSGNAARQPAQGEMRRFILRARIEARSAKGGTALVYSDTNKAFLIKAGWIVKSVVPVIRANASAYTVCQLKDSGGVTFGPTFGLDGTSATAGDVPFRTTWMSDGVGGATAVFYLSDDYMLASFAAVNFDGCIDLHADIIDTNAYENAGVSWSNNNL